MLSSGAGRSTARLLSKSTCTRHIRIEATTKHFQRAAAAYSTLANGAPLLDALRKFPVSIRPLQTLRSFTDQPPRKLKARRTASKPRATKSTPQTKVATKAKKPAAKKKPKPKPTTTKPKAKLAGRPRIQLTPEQKKKAQIRELRKTALKVPKKLPDNAYTVINSELTKSSKVFGGTEGSKKYKNIVPEELEHYNHVANENKVTNNAAYRAWVQSHTPLEINKANNARLHLKRLGVKGFTNSLRDDRQLKRPAPPLSTFLKERYQSGDMKGIPLRDASAVIAREFKELSATDKKRLEQQYSQAREQYVKDVKRVYGRDVRTKAVAAKAA